MGGTSTGGIITALLAYENKQTSSPKLTANDILNLYMTKYEQFFPQKNGLIPNEIHELFSHAYTNDGLRKELKKLISTHRKFSESLT